MKTRSLVLLLATACSAPAPAADAGPDCTVALAWGHRVGGEFVPFEDGDEAEITLGFQGFRYIWSAARVSDTSASGAVFDFHVEVSGHAPYSQMGVGVPMTAGPQGRYADQLLVFFNDIPLPEMVGRDATIVTRVTADGCRGDDRATVRLVDRDDCIDEQDGGVGCTSADAGP